VSGTLREEVGAMDALRSVLPAGTLSGAPKVRAMQIIDELEPVKRGGYGGAIGYLSYTGDLDTCIHIRTVVIKDLKTFFRDTGQWSQLFMLFALVIVYVYNFSVLPVGGVGGSFYLQNIIAFFNLALAGFVLASIAVRFVFPALSLEGKTFWVLKSAPVPLRRWWWSKFWVGLLPLLFLGELLVIITNYFLGVSTFMMVLSAITLFFLTFGIVALGMAIGVAYPNFTAEHSAKIAASFGGVLYMVLCIGFIGLVAYGFANLSSGHRRNPARVLRQVASMPLLTPLQLMNANKAVAGVHIGRLMERVDLLTQELTEVLALWAAGTIAPRIDAAYPFAEAAEAHRRILSHGNTGKIILTP